MSETIAEKISKDDIQKQNIRVAVTRSEFMIKMPRFYRAFNYVDMWPDSQIPTFATAPIYEARSKKLTGYHDLMWNPNFTIQLSDMQLIGAQMHELLHIILGHTTSRLPELKSFTVNQQGQAILDSKSDTFKEDLVKTQIWNIATDLAINCMIKSYLQDPKGLQELGLFPGKNEFAQFPEFKTAEFYYEELMKQHQQNMKDLDKILKELKKQFDKGKIGSHCEWVESDEKGKVTKESASKTGAQKKTETDQKSANIPITVDDISKELDEISEDLGLGKQAGNSGGTTKYTDLSKGKELKTPGWMKKTTHASVHGFEVSPVATRKVPNRRYGILFPGRKRVTHRNKCLIAVDVSGSISKSLLNKFTEHLNKMKKYADFDLFFFNQNIIDKTGQSYSPDKAEKALCKWKTGMNFYISGGTDFEPLFIFWNRVRTKYDSFFIFTDGQADYQTPPIRSKEVNWILYSCSYSTNIKHGNKYNIDKPEEN